MTCPVFLRSDRNFREWRPFLQPGGHAAEPIRGRTRQRPDLFSRAAEVPVASPSYRDIALHYCVDDAEGATTPGTRLQAILDGLRLGRLVTRLSEGFLQQRG